MIKLIRQTQLNFCPQRILALPVLLLKEEVRGQMRVTLSRDLESMEYQVFSVVEENRGLKEGESHYEFSSPEV